MGTTRVPTPTPPRCRHGIETIEDLRCHLQVALELEHSTIPPYLCALYSIPDGTNTTVSTLIRSVVMEEMLHMVLAANLLNAIGGTPAVNTPDFIPSYPTYLPNSSDSFVVNLGPFSREAIATFLEIESPTPRDTPPKADGYGTIGQFYDAIKDGFRTLGGTPDLARKLFTGKASHQVTGEAWYYGGGGKPVAVTDLESAITAIDEICEQGEGYKHTQWDHDDKFGEVDELAHFFRFNEIFAGRRYAKDDSPLRPPTGDLLMVDWDGRYPMTLNPRMADYADRPEIQALMLAFNTGYTALLGALHTAFNGRPAALRDAVPLMYELKYRAQALMRVPSGLGDGTTVGPSFEYVPSPG